MKKVLTLFFIAAFSIVLLSQFKFAQTQNVFAQLVTPITPTSPITPTVTTTPTTIPTTIPTPTVTPTPVTPITFAIKGNVTYKIFGRFLALLSRIIPAPGVTVKAQGFFGGPTFTAQTDANGNYVLTVPQTNTLLFQVGPTGGDTNLWVPPLKIAQPNKNVNNLNFQGFMLSF